MKIAKTLTVAVNLALFIIYSFNGYSSAFATELGHAVGNEFGNQAANIVYQNNSSHESVSASNTHNLDNELTTNYNNEVNSILANVLNNGLNLTSAVHDIVISNLNHAVNIVENGQNISVNSQTLLTPGQSLALSQVLTNNDQSLILNASGQAIGGSLATINLSHNVFNLEIPHNVTLVDNTSNFTVNNNLVNYGDIVVNGNFSVTAANIVNLGSITASHDLSLNSSQGIINEGFITANTDLTLNAPVVFNSGLIKSIDDSITITSNANLNLNSTSNANFEAPDGSINILGNNILGSSLDSGKASYIDINQGNYLSKYLNLNNPNAYIIT